MLRLKDVCQLEAFSKGQVRTHCLDFLLAWCYITVLYAGPPLERHWIDVKIIKKLEGSRFL